MTIKDTLKNLSTEFENTSTEQDPIKKINTLTKALGIPKEEINNVISKLSNDSINENLILLGNTGSGKTTFVNYLIGQNLCFTKQRFGSKWQITSGDAIGIGNGFDAGTHLVNLVKNGSTQYIDLAGTKDPGGIFNKIANALLRIFITKDVKEGKILYFIEEGMFEVARGVNVTDDLKIIFDEMNENLKSENNKIISDIISKVNYDLKDGEKFFFEQIIEKLISANNDGEQFNRFLRNNLNEKDFAFFHMPSKDGIYYIKDQKEKIEILIKNTPKIKLNEFFATGSGEDFLGFLNTLNELSDVITKFIIKKIDALFKLKIHNLQLDEVKKINDLFHTKSGTLLKLMEFLKNNVLNIPIQQECESDINFIESIKVLRPIITIDPIITKQQESFISYFNKIRNVIDKMRDNITCTNDSKHICKITTPFMKLSKIKELVLPQKNQVNKIEVYTAAILFDQDVNLKGQDLVLVASKHKIIDNITINLSGIDGKDYEKDEKIAQYGENALNGKDGKNSGNFLFLTKQFNGDRLTIKLNGGNGGAGQNGYDGLEGVSGKFLHPLNRYDPEKQKAEFIEPFKELIHMLQAQKEVKEIVKFAQDSLGKKYSASTPDSYLNFFGLGAYSLSKHFPLTDIGNKGPFELQGYVIPFAKVIIGLLYIGLKPIKERNYQ